MEGFTKKILIADDDEGIVDVLTMMLEIEGYEVSSTMEGKQIVNVLEQTKPDLLLLDLMISDIDGRDVCRKVKASPSIKNIPVLMISAKNDIKLSVLSSGADGFLAKPFEMQVLLDTVNGMLCS